MTLLGTGAPGPVMNRFGPSTLVEAGGRSSSSMPAEERPNGSRR